MMGVVESVEKSRKEAIKAQIEEIGKSVISQIQSRGGEILEEYFNIDGQKKISAVFSKNRVYLVKYSDGSEAYWPSLFDVTISHHERGAYKILASSPLLAHDQIFIGYPDAILEDFNRFLSWFLNATRNLPSKVIEGPDGLNLTAETLITRVIGGNITTTIETKEIILKQHQYLKSWTTSSEVHVDSIVTSRILRLHRENMKVDLAPLWDRYSPLLRQVRPVVSKIIELQKEGIPIDLSITATADSSKVHLTIEDLGFVTITPEGVQTGYIDFNSKEYKYYELPHNHGKAAIEHLIEVANDWPLPLDESVAIFNAKTTEEFQKIYSVISSRLYYVSRLNDDGYLKEFDFKFRDKDVVVQLFLNTRGWPVILVYAREDGRDYEELPVSREIRPEDPLIAAEFVKELFDSL